MQRGVSRQPACASVPRRGGVQGLGSHTPYNPTLPGMKRQETRQSLLTHTMDVRCRAGEGLPTELKQSIDDFVQENRVVVFMKGTKDMPMCGFSNTVVQILNQLNVPYVTVNVLDNDVLRNGMKEYSMWPTFPQVYVSGEFYGGCDIMIESYTNGELQETLEIALLS